ncbi:MAG: type II toxin-antitoxin system VapC family toxin [Alphaproteobacteria bacterium]|nr:type II toxin-antitoxin system VapC family toxin [Alphaproteobacteria bacterium]
MSFVLDCSVAMAWVFPDESSEATDRLRDSLVNDRAFVPSLWPVEVGSVLLAATRRRRIGAGEWPVICASLDALPIEIEQVPTSCVWGPALALADRHDLSVYDATYLELALRMRLPLATLDRALAAAARAAGVETPATA